MKSVEVADIFFRNYVLIGGIFVSIEQIGSAGMQQQLLNNTTVNNKIFFTFTLYSIMQFSFIF